MGYKKCNMFINHKGLVLKVTMIKKWSTANRYYDLKNDRGYIGYIRCNGLGYTGQINENEEVIKFYDTF
jgi:hypothetical protein